MRVESDVPAPVQALAQREADAEGDELAGLAADADLPLDQLLASLGYLPGAGHAAEPAGAQAMPGQQAPQGAGAAPGADRDEDLAMPDPSSDEGEPWAGNSVLSCSGALCAGGCCKCRRAAAAALGAAVTGDAGFNLPC